MNRSGPQRLDSLALRASDIATNSILLDPLDVGEISDAERHNVTFGPSGSNPTLHSEQRLAGAGPGTSFCSVADR